MEKTNKNSDSSVCRKIRQAIASNPAVRAIQRISSFNQTAANDSNSPSPPTKTKTNIQTKPPPHQHKGHTHTHTAEAAGSIPIKFDHTTPKSKENRVVPKGASSTTHVRNSEGATKGEPHHHVHNMQRKEQHAGHVEAHDKKPMDINDHFQKFIQSTKDKLRTVSNIGRSQGSPASAPDHHEPHHHDTNKNESQYYFSEFIHRAKKKLRTTTIVGKTGSIKKECGVEDYIRAMKRVCCEVLEAMADGLGLGRNVFSRMVREERSDSCLRVNRYPLLMCGVETLSGQNLIGFGEHTDPQIISVLRSNNTTGLQICLTDGTWASIPPDHSSFFVNVGDLLQVLLTRDIKDFATSEGMRQFLITKDVDFSLGHCV
ncbi:hypothetical protein RJT34_22690 [Clitoria ternatea]|uniref:Fe2OG dioxygenase domain-containing protein n=1 Tax=Clitoria ternatea TaxID=43366 RepID=A0AAN9IHQ2_CLITE